MRPVSGFERPQMQWLFVGVGAVLVVVAVAEATALRRVRAEVASVRAAQLGAQIERDEARTTLTHERSAREALSLEVARLRGNGGAAAALPTLTLSPLTRRRSVPPEATVEPPADGQAIQLRLLLPPRRPADASTYTIAVRTWSGGETVWTRSGLRAATVDRQPLVAAFVTGDVFASGAYEVALSAITPGGNMEIASYEIAVDDRRDR
jgi:hypothetical protein